MVPTRHLANGVRIILNAAKPAVINGLIKLRNPYSWLLIFSGKIPLFSKDLVTFMISFISLFVSVILEPTNKIPFSFFLPRTLTPVSTSRFVMSLPLGKPRLYHLGEMRF